MPTAKGIKGSKGVEGRDEHLNLNWIWNNWTISIFMFLSKRNENIIG
jgi:hypothetical protein